MDYWTKCERCDGDGKAHGSDRPFESDGEGNYPGPCPVCKGSGKIEFVPENPIRPAGSKVTPTAMPLG